MKYFISYLKNKEVHQGVIMADNREEIFNYLKRINAKTWCVSPAKSFLRNAKSLPEVKYNPKVIATSKLAKVEIAAEDYNIGGKEVDGKHYFTFDEALEVQEKLKDTGWRLPTRSEWTLICEEFGQKDDGELDYEVLYRNLHMGPTGWLDEDGYLGGRTTNGYWWSGTAGSATYGRDLSTWAGNVYAQHNAFRGRGFALRLVRDAKENN